MIPPVEMLGQSHDVFLMVFTIVQNCFEACYIGSIFSVYGFSESAVFSSSRLNIHSDRSLGALAALIQLCNVFMLSLLLISSFDFRLLSRLVSERKLQYCVAGSEMNVEFQSYLANYCLFCAAPDIRDALDETFPEQLMTVRPGIAHYLSHRDILCIHCKVQFHIHFFALAYSTFFYEFLGA
jgi:hypothetical protein